MKLTSAMYQRCTCIDFLMIKCVNYLIMGEDMSVFVCFLPLISNVGVFTLPFSFGISSGHLNKLEIESQGSILGVKMAVNYMTSSSISKCLPPNKISIQKSLYTNIHMQFATIVKKKKKKDKKESFYTE